MRKIILFFLLAIASSSCFAQNDVVTEICGVKFGSNRPTARSILTAKYGDPNMDELNLIEFDNVRYAGISFDFGYFSFQTDGIRSYFNECILGFFADTADDAKRKREFLKGILGNKYEIQEDIEEDKFKCYYGGTSPVDSDEYAFKLYITKIPKSGYLVSLKYGEFDYLNESL